MIDTENNDMATKTQQATRIEFAHYFLHLKESMEAEGGKVSKFAEWENFIGHLIEEGDLPAEASSWKCPRSLEAEISKEHV